MKSIFITMITLLMAHQTSKNRTVIIFTDKADNSTLTQQLDLLKTDPNGIKNRDIVIKTVTYENNQAPYKTWHVTNAPFTILLIGKDNSEKLRSHQPVTLAKLFELIDSMPMRQDEMKKQNK